MKTETTLFTKMISQVMINISEVQVALMKTWDTKLKALDPVYLTDSHGVSFSFYLSDTETTLELTVNHEQAALDLHVRLAEKFHGYVWTNRDMLYCSYSISQDPIISIRLVNRPTDLKKSADEWMVQLKLFKHKSVEPTNSAGTQPAIE